MVRPEEGTPPVPTFTLIGAPNWLPVMVIPWSRFASTIASV
jgi:hypothetical protein